MSVIPITKTVNSAELARVREVTPLRHFWTRNDDEVAEAKVVYNVRHDELYCATCGARDNCTHTARVRLCGILTNTVTEKAGIAHVRGNNAR